MGYECAYVSLGAGGGGRGNVAFVLFICPCDPYFVCFLLGRHCHHLERCVCIPSLCVCLSCPRPAKDPGEGDVCAPEGPAGVCDIVQGICSVLLLPFTTPVTSEVLGAPEPTPSLATGKERGRYVAQGVVSAPVPSLLATVQHTLFRVAAVRVPWSLVSVCVSG